ncbi:MAG: hypothetical protein ACTMIR_05480 [Cellulomonadaceae bacterium]
MAELHAPTQVADIDAEVAAADIAKSVGARHTIARKYVLRLRRRHPQATPVEIVQMLERHYVTSISTAGTLVAAGAIAADVGIALIPVAGAAAVGAKSAGQQAAKKAGKEVAKGAVKVAAKGVALNTAKTGAQRLSSMIPAGDQQLQFEITAIFGLALADIHGMHLDQDQAHALIYGLCNERVSQSQIATMAEDLAEVSAGGTVDVSRQISTGQTDWSHWATTLSDALPAGAARTLVSTIQTGQLDTVREGLSDKQRTTVEYGMGALVGGITRFIFGREVVTASRTAFPAAPEDFPPHLTAITNDASLDDAESEPNRALAALDEAAKTTGAWVTETASAVGGGVAKGAHGVGTGVATAADKVTRPFRKVDLDGDGVPDEARAVTAARDAGASIAGAAATVGGSVAGLFKSRKRSEAASE